MKDTTEFLKELTELTEKHGIVIGGCGCCGSPFLQEFGDLNEANDWCFPGGYYEAGGGTEDLNWVDPEPSPERIAVLDAQSRRIANEVAERNKARESLSLMIDDRTKLMN